MRRIHYGGDYNPDQWPEHIQDSDFELFRKAGVNILTLPVFSWVKFQSDEEHYHFEWFDRIMGRLQDEGFAICLATSTAVQPPWMAQKYPEMMPVDFEGRRRKYGGRVKFCPNNPDYRRLSGELVRRMAERYGGYSAVRLWHVGNEYDNWCYCDHCEAEFRAWLRDRYVDITELNQAWYTSFWGHQFTDWDEIVAPSGLSEMWMDNGRPRSNFQAISLDYARFMSESVFGCYKNEYDILKDLTPHIPVTTNFMGYFKALDYFRWAENIDVISWDSYPGIDDPPLKTSLWHDLMRSLKRGRSFLLLEQTPSQTNWQPYNAVKGPGVLRLQSWQAVARGSDSVMFFQMRRSAGACEKFHSALIDHVGHGGTRVFMECAALGAELAQLPEDLVGAEAESSAAIIFDWENWWSLDYSSGPSNLLRYDDQVASWYRYFHANNIPVDFVHPDGDFSQYSVVIAPCLYMIREQNARRLQEYVAEGGSLVATFLSGIVNEHDRIHLGGYPGPFREVLGIWVEEIDALPPDRFNSAKPTDSGDRKLHDRDFRCELICDIMHLEGAQVLAEYGEDFYAGTPVVTVNRFGKGRAFYVGSSLEPAGIDFVLAKALKDSDKPYWHNWTVPKGVEISSRKSKEYRYIFIMNHNDDRAVISGLPSADDCCWFPDSIASIDRNGNWNLGPKEVALLRQGLPPRKN